MKKIKVLFTKKEFEILYHHFKANLDYGYGGSFGGHDENDKEEVKKFNQELKIGEKILEKMRKCVN